MLMAAIGRPEWSRTAAATHPTSGSFSPSSTAQPRPAGDLVGFEVLEVLQGADDAVGGTAGEPQLPRDRIGGNLLVPAHVLQYREPAFESSAVFQPALRSHSALRWTFRVSAQRQ